MFRDANEIPGESQLECDVCIIGAGAAGIAMARALDGGTLRVIVLESGGREPDQRTQALADGDNVGLPYFPMIVSRLRLFGGSTNHWGGVCHPFQARDFEANEQVPDSGWPIRKQDLDPFYSEAAEFCGVEAADRLDPGITGAGASEFGEGFEPRTIQRVPEVNRRFREHHSEPLERSRNVTTILNANVTEIRAETERERVTGLQVATVDGNRFGVVARSVVLATGGIENARILLASSRDRPAGLGNDRDLVGRYFLEHPRFVAGFVSPSDPFMKVTRYGWHRSRGASIRDYLDCSPALKQREAIYDVQLRLATDVHDAFAGVDHTDAARSALELLRSAKRSELRADFGKHVQIVARDLMRWQRAALPGAPIPVPRPELVRRWLEGSRYERSSLLRAALGDIAAIGLVRGGDVPIDRLEVTAILQQAPNRESRIRLGSRTDALGMPRASLDWRLTEDDRRSVRRTVELFASAVGRSGLGRVQILDEPEDGSWPRDMRGGYHHMGTTRMSDDPKRGVVDRDCRVHGLANLYVAGSSVFPTAGSGSPTLTLVALALRLAEHLKGRLA